MEGHLRPGQIGGFAIDCGQFPVPTDHLTKVQEGLGGPRSREFDGDAGVRSLTGAGGGKRETKSLRTALGESHRSVTSPIGGRKHIFRRQRSGTRGAEKLRFNGCWNHPRLGLLVHAGRNDCDASRRSGQDRRQHLWVVLNESNLSDGRTVRYNDARVQGSSGGIYL